MKLTISLRSFIYYKYLTNINFFPYFLFRCIISTLQPRLTLNLSGERFSFNDKIFFSSISPMSELSLNSFRPSTEYRSPFSFDPNVIQREDANFRMDGPHS